MGDGDAGAWLGAAVPVVSGRWRGVILAAGQPQTAAVIAGAAKFPKTRFVVVGPGSAAANVTLVLPGPAASVRSAVAGLVEAATR